MTKKERHAQDIIRQAFKDFGNNRLDKWEFYEILFDLMDKRLTTLTRICINCRDYPNVVPAHVIRSRRDQWLSMQF